MTTRYREIAMNRSMLPLGLGLWMLAAPVLAIEQGSLEACRAIQAKIDYYTDLKRQGGSASQINNWHRMRNKYKQKFSYNNCKVYRGKLR